MGKIFNTFQYINSQMNKNAGQMRLQREAKMAVRDLDNQIKKFGMIKDQNFICLPDPNNVYEWYYVVFGLEAPYEGGYYIGKVKCKDTYPSTAPNITIYTDNGRFRTHRLQPDGICLSISDFHQESWNPLEGYSNRNGTCLIL